VKGKRRKVKGFLNGVKMKALKEKAKQASYLQKLQLPFAFHL
jgi:hypothetical protein